MPANTFIDRAAPLGLSVSASGSAVNDPNRVPASERLDRSSFVPLYYQLQEIIKQQIESGVWRPGTPLPAEPSLAQQFGVSRVVVRRALGILADDRQIIRVKGVGTFVAEAKLESRAGGLYRLRKEVRDPGVEIHVLQNGVAEIERSVRAGLSTDEKRALGLTFRVSLQEMTIAIGQSFFPLRDGNWLAQNAPAGAVLTGSSAQAPVNLGRSEISIEVSRCDQFEAEVFGIDVGHPVFLVHSLEFSKTPDANEPLEFSRVVYRSDVIQFRFEREPQGDQPIPSPVWSVTPPRIGSSPT